MPPSFQQLGGLLLNSCIPNATNQEGAARGGGNQPHHKHDIPPQPLPPTACGTADNLLQQELQGEEGEEEGVTHTMSDMTAHSTDTYIAAVAEAAARKRPLLSSATLPGVAASAVLDTPTEEPRAPSHDFHVLLIRGAAGAAAAAAALGLLGWLAFKGTCFLMGGTLPVLMTWCAVEAGFWVWFRQHAARLDEQPRPHMPCNQDPLLHFRRLIAHARFYRDTCRRPVDWESYVSMWFRGAPVAAVGMENLKEMVAYGFFYRTKSELVASGEWPLVEAMVAELCGMSARDGAAATSTVATGLEPTGPGSSPRRGRTLAVIKPGYTQGLQYMAHLWEPLRWNHRPLAMYIGTEAISLITATFLCAIGFRVGVHQGGRYFYRPAQPGSSEKARSPQQPHNVPATGISTGAAAASAATVPDQSQGHTANDSSAFGKVAALMGSGSGSKLAPIVCLHGVGLGVTPYLLFVVRLAASRAPMLVPEFAHIGLRLCARVPCCSEVADRVAATMSHVGISKACVVAHSYGTFIASRMVQAHSGRVHSLALIDPVCFGMFLPSLLNNFVYRTPRDVLSTGGLAAAAKACLLYLIARDVHCATSVCRRFYWTDVNLWAEELPALSLVVLSGRDELMHADEVRQVVAGGQYIGIRRGPFPMTSAEAFPHMSSSSPNDAATDAAAVHAAAPDAPILPLPHTLYTIPSSVSAHDPGSPTQPTTPPLTPPYPNTLSTSSITRCEPNLPNSSTDVPNQGAAAHCMAHTGHAATDSQVSQSSQLQPPPQQRTVSVGSNWGPLLEGLAAPPANARMLYHPTASHADFLLDNGWQAEVVEQVLCLAAEEPATQQVARRRTTIVGSSSMGPGPYLGSSSMHTSRMGSLALASAATSRMGSLEEGHGPACGLGTAGMMQRGGGALGRYPTSSGHEASAWAGGGSGWGVGVGGGPLGAAAWGVPGAGDVRDTHVREASAVVAMFKQQQQSAGQAGLGGQRGGGTLRQRVVAAAAPVETSPGRSSGGVLDCVKLAAGSSPAGDPRGSRVQGLGAVLACVERSPSLPAVARKGSAGAVAGAHNWVDLRSF